MPYLGSGESGRSAGSRARSWETNNYQQGRKGSKVPILTGPAKNPKHNPTKGGGINRATRARGGGAMQD
jgi:hypothetical protein